MSSMGGHSGYGSLPPSHHQDPPQPPPALEPPPPAWKTENVEGMDKDTLVMHIKDMQKADSGAKEQWVAYTDIAAEGVRPGTRDPNKHTEEFLQGFIRQMQSGQKLVP